METRLSAAAILLAAALTAPVHAGPPAAAAPAAPAEPAATEETPPITIVGGGGLAEVYRAEGAGYAAYGPDHKAPARPPEPVQAPVLRALEATRDMELVALDAAAGAVADLSCGSACVGGYPVRARKALDKASGAEVRRTVLRWLGEPREGAPAFVTTSACAPAFRHAVKFAHDGYRYEVLLAADCGRYRMLRGGVPVAEGDAAGPGPLQDFDRLLGEAAR